jgi:hypothetical protein
MNNRVPEFRRHVKSNCRVRSSWVEKGARYRYGDLGSFLASHERGASIPRRGVEPFSLPESRRHRERLLKLIVGLPSALCR